MSDSAGPGAWKEKVLMCRAEHPEWTHRQVAEHCRAPSVCALKRFVAAERARRDEPSLGQDKFQPSKRTGAGEGASAEEAEADTSKTTTSGSHAESSEQARARGNDALKQGDAISALRFYEEAMALDPLCVLAASNAAEVALRLQRPGCAHKHALTAFSLDRTHQKTWARLVRSLAQLQRAAEAYVWVADRAAEGLLNEQSVIDLTSLVAAESPFCYGFKKGLYVCQAPLTSREGSRASVAVSLTTPGQVLTSRYSVRTAVALAAKETLTQERAVLPWTHMQYKDPCLLTHFLRTATPADFEKLNGLVPRRFVDVPTKAVQSLSNLEHKIREYFDGGGSSYRSNDPRTEFGWEQAASRKQEHATERKPISEEEVREYVRVLAVAKLCAHDDGVHHFGAFYNHSCAPNCEVRGYDNLEIVATRAIKPGEELCIVYFCQDNIARSGVDLSVVCRRLQLERGWGEPCCCSRCVDELADLVARGEEEASCGEEAWMQFQEAVMDTKDECQKSGSMDMWYLPNPHVIGVGQFGDFLKALEMSGLEILRDWRSVPWKETYVLGFLSGERSTELEIMAAQVAGSKAAALSLWKKLEMDHAPEYVSRLYELRARYAGPASGLLQFENRSLLAMMAVYIAAGKSKPSLGWHTAKAMRNRMEGIRKEASFPF